MQEHSKQRRRRHSAEFKAEVIQACEQPGASTAGVALAFSLNANLVRQWCRGRGVLRAGLAAPAARAPAVQRFIPLTVAEPAQPMEAAASPQCESACIDLQLRRGELAAHVRWPVTHAGECARLLRELLR